ncbi:tyrosine-type recombinase/integrase [Paracidovorax anthurii]|uniref:Site-specific recombinase XerD n=1 Tax=Paracidovorax anthurii TaxID=78229 RepID=A0A328Z7E9_9BURK|nr:tyrosine-type recombinase/integrase [Paracidovorax anthurii]RAR78176.1 site-specific recombinase XerD [Paracidovorax anthurii]
MQAEERPDDTQDARQRASALSVEMLRAVLDGGTYEAVAAQHGVTRTAVERRIKAVAVRLAANGIEGLNTDAAAMVRRLRAHRSAVLSALEGFDEAEPAQDQDIHLLTDEEIATGALRIRGRSHQPLEDLALYYLLLATGARPLEIARLEVRDYLASDGGVRHASEIRAEVAITGRERPVYFRSTHLTDALDAYLADRIVFRRGMGEEGRYRGLDPVSRLFLSASGQGFVIHPYGEDGQRRFRCRAIQETYRKLFRYAELKQVTALTVRHTVADRLYSRGADESQVGLLLGIAERSAVREQFPRRLPTLDALTNDLV